MQAKLTYNKYPFLKELGLSEVNNGCYRRGEFVGEGPEIVSYNPHTNEPIAIVKTATVKQYNECVVSMEEERVRWTSTPAPIRGEIVRQIGIALREKKDALGALLTLEMGKIRTEGLGEVQEYIDICDMAVGLSRTIEGKVIPSERPGHFMMENWNPIGNVGVITAFNFPMAVSGWNTAIALICGNTVVWKGAENTSLTTVALHKVVADVLLKHGFKSVCTMLTGEGSSVGEAIVIDKRIPLVSFTGSTAVGRMVS
jgi:aldehyde dehydrogenase family 7 member A1